MVLQAQESLGQPEAPAMWATLLRDMGASRGRAPRVVRGFGAGLRGLGFRSLGCRVQGTILILFINCFYGLGRVWDGGV